MILGFIARCIVVHLNTSFNTSQYIVEYIIIPLKYMYYKMCCDTGIYCKMYCGTSQYICRYMTIHRRIHHNTSKIHVLQDLAWPTCPIHSGKSLVGLGESSADWPVCYVSLKCHCRITAGSHVCSSDCPDILRVNIKKF